MNMILIISLVLSLVASADTPPPNTVKAKTFSGDGVTSITATGSSLNVNITNASGLPVDTSGSSGSGSGAAATVSSVATLTAPTGAIGFILMNLSSSTTNMRWSVGRTAGTTLGQRLEPGRDTGFVPVGANVSIIAESGTVNYDVQWVSQ